MNDNFEIERVFIDDLPELSGSAIKVFLLFKEMARNKPDTDGVWIHCGYEHIMKKTAIKHKATVRKAIVELARAGWFGGFKRGYYDKARGIKMTNSYCIPLERIDHPAENLKKEWYLKLTNDR